LEPHGYLPGKRGTCLVLGDEEVFCFS